MSVSRHIYIYTCIHIMKESLLVINECERLSVGVRCSVCCRVIKECQRVRVSASMSVCQSVMNVSVSVGVSVSVSVRVCRCVRVDA